MNIHGRIPRIRPSPTLQRRWYCAFTSRPETAGQLPAGAAKPPD